jgi:pyruvate dehydrogenase E2 component (dihydrolipoamide acetyltransferase)
MIHEIRVPDLGDGAEGKFIRIAVNVGDTVTTETVVAEIALDKADAEVPAETEGEVVEILAQKDDVAKTGTVIMRIKAAGSAAAEAAPAAPAAAAPAPAAPTTAAAEVDVKVPDLGDASSAKLIDFAVKVGDTVTKDTTIANLGMDKADAEVPADIEGVVTALVAAVGSDVKVGDVLIKVQTSGGVAAPAAPAAAAPVAAAPIAVAAKAAPVASASTTMGKARVSPLARKRARELGVDLSGFGDHERVSVSDVIEAFKKQATRTSGGGSGPMAQRALPDFSKYGPIRKEKMSRITELTADNLSYAWSTIPHAWILEKVDITRLEAHRNQHKEAVKAKGASLTITALIAKAVAAALKSFPQFNASVDMEAKEIIFKDYIHLGIAVDTPKGLLVPVIRDCDKKSIFQIAQDLSQISKDARDGKPVDMSGGTFSISNIGGIGGTGLLPIVNPPQSAILGVTSGNMEAVWNGTAFEPRLMMQISVGFDHRIINGADATRFLVKVKEILEDPFLLSLW